METWYALRIKRHKETAVCRLLQLREVTTYYPTIRVAPVNPRSARIRPYFPGYMFIQADLEEIGHNALEWLPGSRGLVAFGGVPAIVPDHLIEALKKQVAQLRNRQHAPPQFYPGDKVRIVNGPLAGYEAIFDTELSGNLRVQVLLTYLHNQPKPVKIDRTAIIKI